MSVVKRCVPVLLLALCGCSVYHPHPTKALYVLQPAELDPMPSAQPIAIEIGRAQVAPPFDSLMFQYRVGVARYEPAYYAQWADKPGLLLAESVSQSMSSTSAFVVLDDASGVATPSLHLHVTELYADVRKREAPGVVVAIRATLLDARGNVLMVRGFRHERPSDSEQPADVIAAWTASVNETVRALVPELQAALGGG